MQVNIVESINLCLNSDEKSVLIDIINIVNKIKEINLDSNNALEEIDAIKKNESLSKFVEIFSDLMPIEE